MDSRAGALSPATRGRRVLEPGRVDVVLHPGRERSVRRRHPWVLSGAVAHVVAPDSRPGEPAPGAWARVLSSAGETLAHGHLSPRSSLRVRLLSFGKETPDDSLLARRIGEAVARRTASPLLADTDALRLVNAEGDGLPGLVADRYADTVVVKLTSAGMVARREGIARGLQEATGAACGYERADSAAARREGLPARQGALWGEPPREAVAVLEGSRGYAVDVLSGQKTGFYLDQRDARDLVESLARGRHVLDLFAYTGGFSVAAGRGGAARVTLVESSATALDLARSNLAAAAPELEAHPVRGDAFRFLREQGPQGARFDLIALDPPPLARHRRDVARASRAYKDLMLHALRCAAPGALLLAFACSHHMGPDLFRKIAFAAAQDAERPVRVLRTLGAPVDHPVALEHPEGSYLTGLLLEA